MHRLIPEGGASNSATREVPLGASVVSVGRTPGNVVVLDDRELSKRHAEIVPAANGYLVRDLGSSNGTFVNGRRIKEQRLSSGDVLELGSARYRYTDASEPTAAGGAQAALPVAILPASPIDRTTVLAASTSATLVAGRAVRDLEQLRILYDRVRVAFEAVHSLLEVTELRQLCDQILEVTWKLLRAETGAVLLFDSQQQLVPWAHKGLRAEGERVVISRTIVEEVMRRRAAVLASDALCDARFGSAQSIVMSGVRSLMCVPLSRGEQVFGLLHVGNSKEVGAFTAADLELMTGIGAGAGLALANAFLAQRLADEARTRESLGRFLSPVLVEQVLSKALDLKRGGQEAEVTVMFADIRGFTPLTERSEPTAIVALLNEYFDQMVEIVFRHNGLLDKFIGDALMAVWGAPVAHVDDAARALQAAHEMQQTLASFNDYRRDRGLEPIAIGVGLASGRCVSGAMGARRRMEYTVIGDAVNLASRLAGIAKGGQVLCDEATQRRAGSAVGMRSLPSVQVKGKTKPVAIFELAPPADARR